MGHARFKIKNGIAAFLVAAALTPSAASAGGKIDDGWNDGPSSVYSSPASSIYSFHGDYSYQTTTPWDYAAPILAVYQFPAVIADQPGSEVGYLRISRRIGILGGRPYLYHQ